MFGREPVRIRLVAPVAKRIRREHMTILLEQSMYPGDSIQCIMSIFWSGSEVYSNSCFTFHRPGSTILERARGSACSHGRLERWPVRKTASVAMIIINNQIELHQNNPLQWCRSTSNSYYNTLYQTNRQGHRVITLSVPGQLRCYRVTL